jgi:hypothetical protein
MTTTDANTAQALADEIKQARHEYGKALAQCESKPMRIARALDLGPAIDAAIDRLASLALLAAPLPRSDSQEARAAIETVFAERNWPTSPAACARAGFEAAFRLASQAAEQEPVAWQSRMHLGGKWTAWKECEAPAPGEPRETMLAGKIAYQFRPLYTAPVREQSERDAETVAVDATAWDAFMCDYERYAAGELSMPFSTLRGSLSEVIRSAAKKEQGND